MADPTARLGAARYAVLTTFRRDGAPVPTAVWVAPIDGAIGVWTTTDSGKVKRIRRDGHIELAESDSRGRPLGPAVAGTARVLDRAGTEQVLAAIRRKYGLLGRLLTTLSGWRRGKAGTTGLAVTLE
ncbi:PPOX class F420-dependent oxidoreductase [Pseudonocardia acidicola]|uniref:PPOX class F420-dependent oxidoreductase n=1 Tax=Pseudonocardia acidicola TaxID=2724939 RepID=A0ABX1SGY9_9PSEU|nr:PPOX class F420-dependent oxidoreductase [Pseudonocardia acidicola]NMI00840.1 PPOX class F420-dependent oxidoreductase [Pseudonocardia acidicola]